MAQSIDTELKDKILAKPDVILDDQELMKALLKANDTAKGSNIVDIRGAAMQRLETRLGRLEDTHQSVIAAAYENLAGTNQIQRAVLRFMDHLSFESFLDDLDDGLRSILRVDCVLLVFETPVKTIDPNIETLMEFDCVRIVPKGYIGHFMSQGAKSRKREVVLQKTSDLSVALYGPALDIIKSEAVMRLDLGEKRLPAMLVLGAKDPKQFQTQQGTDLLVFFASAFERMLRHWLN